MQNEADLGSPVVPSRPFNFGVSLLEPKNSDDFFSFLFGGGGGSPSSSRIFGKKGTLIIEGLLGSLAMSPMSLGLIGFTVS